MFSDPIDLLKIYINEVVMVKLRSGEEILGSLMGFDEHSNILLRTGEDSVFIRGENVVFIGQSK